MRKRTLTAMAFVAIVAVIAAACSSAGGGSAGASSPSAASPDASGLTGKAWQLTAITTKVPAFQGVIPAADQAKYTIEFKSDGTFAAKADCNQVAGAYTTTASGGMTITPGPSTMAMCPPESLGSQYVAALSMAASYKIEIGELTITSSDQGTLQYK
jgi:heat shock protein HslJ